MKIRNGFVSNSSTSSFVIIGYEFDRHRFTEEELFGFLEVPFDGDFYTSVEEVESKYDVTVMNHEESGARNEDKSFIGKIVCNVNSDCNDNETEIFDYESIEKSLHVIAEKLHLDSKIVVMSGTRMC